MASTKLFLVLVVFLSTVCLFEMGNAASLRKKMSSAIEATGNPENGALLKRMRRSTFEMTRIQTIAHEENARKMFLKWLKRYQRHGRSTFEACINAYLRLYGKHHMKGAVKACM